MRTPILVAMSTGLALCWLAGCPPADTASNGVTVVPEETTVSAANPHAESATPGTEAPLPEGARLVTDISGSMKGFILPGSVRLSSLHEELVGAIGEVSPGELEYCLVAEDLSCDTRTGTERYSTKALYSGASSRFDKALDLDAEDGPQTRRVTVVVTDGVFGGTSSAGGASGEGCMAGATTACIAERLAALVRAGFGVWVVGAALPFDGRVYAERAMDQAHFDAIGPGLQDFQQVSAFKPSPSSASYSYLGPRPLLVLVVSRDVELGRTMLGDLQQRLAKAGVVHEQGEGIVGSEWAPLQVERSQLVALEIDPASKTEGFLVSSGGRTEQGYTQRLQCGRNDQGRFLITVSSDASLLELRPDDDVSAAVVPHLKPRDGGFSLGIVCDPLAKKSETTLHFELWAADELARNADDWWARWSADDTYTHPDRLFGLGDLAAATVREAARDLGKDDDLWIRVERK